MEVNFEPFFDSKSPPPLKVDFPYVLNGGGTSGPGTLKFGIGVSIFVVLGITQTSQTYFCSEVVFHFF